MDTFLAATTARHHDYRTSSPNFLTSSTVPISPQNLPMLSRRENLSLINGERVQKQDRVEGAGRGVVVMDVKASKEDIFNTLIQFERYAEIIPTVREVNVYRKLSEFRTAVSLFYLFSLDDLFLSGGVQAI